MKSSAAILRLPRQTQIVKLDDGPATIELCRRAIRTSHLKYYEIAQRSGVCVQAVSKIAYGDTRFPRMSTVVRILVAMGWTVYASED